MSKKGKSWWGKTGVFLYGPFKTFREAKAGSVGRWTKMKRFRPGYYAARRGSGDWISDEIVWFGRKGGPE